jgi:single-stranded DNA-binding protein
MSMHILLTGTLHKDPTQRTSQNGKAFVTCSLRIEQEGGTIWASVICFDQAAREELLRCHAGDTVAIQGKLKVTVYERNGEHRPSLDVVANGVLPAKPKPSPARSKQECGGQTARGFDAPFNNDIPF